ncbi:NADH dehydrogenase [ubiquinone] 1 alpha subcomplex assembly factor 4-like isoform X1 [Apostichopus japonicus]|uniref:NADH dehydrogenase [ubiquinone] 1 alpha subcomplex assembly factor 4-like isoform X1 n=1 Tax=Stichopus japonicus TaxID=307972 RepID=UPI003AB8EB30
MGNVFRRGWRNFNVENRAHKFIEKHSDKPLAPPKYPESQKMVQHVEEKGFPKAMQEHLQKNAQLLDRLKDVKVDSTDVEGKSLGIEIDKDIPSEAERSLPLSRSGDGSPDLFPDEVPAGRISVQKAMELLAKHKQDKEKWTAERLAQDCKLDLTDTENILDNFQAFKIIPQNPNDPNPKLPIYEKRQLSAD